MTKIFVFTAGNPEARRHDPTIGYVHVCRPLGEQP
jgi:hypothetical protein